MHQSPIDILFPQTCSYCKQPIENNTLLCTSCTTQLARVRLACRRCGQRLGRAAELCGHCLSAPCPQHRTLAPFWFSTAIATQIKHFKYGLKPSLAKPLARLLLNEMRSHLAMNDTGLELGSTDIESLLPLSASRSNFGALQTLYSAHPHSAHPHSGNTLSPCTSVIPIPSERSKLRHRGFNPAALIARHIGSSLGLPIYYHVLRKKDNAPSQVGSSRAKRLSQAQGQLRINQAQFERLLRQRKSTTDHHILLIDDVLTTGATLRAAAKLLTENGIKQVTAACIALTP